MEKRPYPGSKFSTFIPFIAKNLAPLIWPKYNSHPCLITRALPEWDDVHLELVVSPDVEHPHVLGERLALTQRRGHGAAGLRDEERLRGGNISEDRVVMCYFELVGSKL